MKKVMIKDYEKIKFYYFLISKVQHKWLCKDGSCISVGEHTKLPFSENSLIFYC